MNGLILGRSPVLWYGFLVALFNVLVVMGAITATLDTVASVDTVLALGLALLANSSDPRTVPTFALTTSAPSETTPPTIGTNG